MCHQAAIALIAGKSIHKVENLNDTGKFVLANEVNTILKNLIENSNHVHYFSGTISKIYIFAILFLPEISKFALEITILN